MGNQAGCASVPGVALVIVRNVSGALAQYLASRPSTNYMVSAHTFTLTDGTVLRYADTAVNLSVLPVGGGTPTVWLPGVLLIKRPTFKCGLGGDPDKQTITIGFKAPSNDSPSLVEGIPFAQALTEGLFTGAAYSCDEFYWSSGASFQTGQQPIGNNTATVNGGTTDGRINAFTGFVGAIKSLSRIQCQIDVNDVRIRLDTDFPRNTYYAQCRHTLYGPGCGLNRAAFTQSYTATGGTFNTATYASSETAATYALGALTFTSGANAGRTRQVQSDSASSLVWVMPLGTPVAAGDEFSVSWGCDHTLATCTNKFGNNTNYLGFISVPPPQITI